jgi:hypothetical protein
VNNSKRARKISLITSKDR